MAEYSVKDSIAVIKLDNAPVNSLSAKVRSAIDENLKRAVHDDKVKAVVLCGKRGVFCAGADIKEFDGGNKGPWITDIGTFMDNMKKPVVAAIEGFALGGGLEVALFCHYRIATKSAKLGQPEVQIGLIPGGGGTVRLSRAAGLANALEIITTGNHVPAPQALKMGLIDEIVSGDIIEEGIKFAKSKAYIDTSLVCLRMRNVKVNGDINRIAEDAMQKVKTKYKGYIAPIVCVRSIINSTKLPYQKAIDLEMEYFLDLKDSSQSKAMRYAFFAERAITKWKLPSGGDFRTKPLDVKTAGVIGAGTMGSGIALSLVTSGIPCVLVEQSAELLEKGLTNMKRQLMDTVKLGKMSEEQAKKCFSFLKATVNLQELNSVDLVIEAVFEDLKLKREMFERLDKICKPETVLCTNTSTLDIDSIASATTRQGKVVGTHFFAPPYIMKLLENIYGKDTSAETVATVMKLGKTLRKVPVLVGTCTGFVANRMLGPFSKEAQFCVEEGAFPSDVDQALVTFGMPMGTFEVSDLSGIDIQYLIRREAALKAGFESVPDNTLFLGERNCNLIARLYEKGRFGRKVGKGWYRYDGPGGRTPYVDPEVTQMIEDYSRALGIQRRSIGSQEILERMLFSMINEGFKILEEGICAMPEEIDIIWIYGFGWPKYMGGPMYYASKIGLRRVYEGVCHYQRVFSHSKHWHPSNLLEKLSKGDVSMDKWIDVARGNSKL